jgi:hypothetical protein
MVQGIQPNGAGLTRGRLRRLAEEPPVWAAFLLCGAVLGLRRAEAWSNPQFWAEDSGLYRAARVDGLAAFAQPMGGYLHTTLRTIALVAAHVDPSLAPAVYVLAATLLTAYVASRAVSARCPLPHFGCLCALAVVLVPETNEVLLNVVNLQWVLGAALILLLISADPDSPSAWINDTVTAAAFGMTGPFCVILSPLFLLRAWLRRSRGSLAVAAIVCSCALVQAYMLHNDPPSPIKNGYVSYRFILPIIGRRIGGSLMIGSLLGPDTDQVLGSMVGIFTVLSAVYLAARQGPFRTARLYIGAAFLLILTGSLYRASNGFYLFFIPETRGRYMYIPQLLVLWLLLSTALQRGREARICTLLCLWGLAVNLPRLREPAYVDLHWEDYAPLVREGRAVTIPVNPVPWVMKIPARQK